MNEIFNKFFFEGDKFMPEMHLRKPIFTYSAYGLFTNNKKIIQKFKETGNSRYIYQSELDKVCFQHDMAYGDFKYLTRRNASATILLDRNMMDIKEVLLQWFITFLIKRLLVVVLKTKIFLIKN